ncbi:MAG: SagB/ThcOx family dehydrogenase [Anaerolineae bacterium]|nr:SagB/ThcOx family dehydrogenase [Anaerolineae bacterium]
MDLPPPQTSGRVPLEEVLLRRRSVRQFEEEPLTQEQISQLLWAAQGLTDPRGFRTAPSAGALYPLELYLAMAEGAFRYTPSAHALQEIASEDRRPDLWRAALRQEAVRQAPAVFVLAAVYERTSAKYGAERSPRYVHLEAGHAAQNLLLQAVAIGLGGVPIGAFDDEAVQAALGLALEEKPLYIIPIGRPRG